MAQRVAGDRAFAMALVPTEREHGGAHGGLHGGIAQVPLGAVKGLGQGAVRRHPAASRRGEHPFGIAVLLPEGAQAGEQFV